MIHSKITLCNALTDEFYQDMITVTDESSQKKMGEGGLRCIYEQIKCNSHWIII